MPLVHMVLAIKHPLVAFREANHLSQAAAAARVGITQEMWSRLEKGRSYASPRVAKRIADLTGVALEILLNFSDNDWDRAQAAAPALVGENTKDLP